MKQMTRPPQIKHHVSEEELRVRTVNEVLLKTLKSAAAYDFGKRAEGIEEMLKDGLKLNDKEKYNLRISAAVFYQSAIVFTTQANGTNSELDKVRFERKEEENRQVALDLAKNLGINPSIVSKMIDNEGLRLRALKNQELSGNLMVARIRRS